MNGKPYVKSAAARGYDAKHRRERRRWAADVAAGFVECTLPGCKRVEAGRSRLILPGEPWDLGHDRVTGGWQGPQHVECNRAEGAAFGNRQRRFDALGKVGVPGRSRW